MKRLSLTLAAVLLVSSQSHAQTGASDFDSIKKLVAKPGAKTSLSVRDEQGNEVINHLGDESFAPASIAKTVSTACSLDVLGPQFQFTTEFGAAGKITGDTLEGDLVVVGTGDPSLVIEDLHEVIEKIRYVHGIKKITGNVIFDVSYFGKSALPIANGFEGDEGRSFTADLTPATFNQNSFSVWVAADVRNVTNSRAVALPAGVVDLKLQNKVKSGGATEVALTYDPKTMQAIVQGVIAREGEPKAIYRAVDDSYAYAVKLLQRLWIDSGGEWKNPTVKISTTAVNATTLYRYQSRPLSKIMMDVNKLSLNLGAEMIMLAAGVKRDSKPATYEKSLKFVKECIDNQQIPAGGISMTNASGLSREARLKASALTLFLSNYARTSVYAPEYLSTFSILGVDGTVRARLKNLAGRARLKTGSLRDVRSIAGYLFAKDGKRYTFTMIQNGVNPNSAKDLEDKVISALLNHKSMN